MHVISLNISKSTMLIYLAKKAQIALLLAEKVKISTKYSDFSDVFSEKKASTLLELIKLNQYAIEWQDSKQPLYEPIYSLGPIELKTLKIYIETNLANDFIRSSKSPAGALILFVKK